MARSRWPERTPRSATGQAQPASISRQGPCNRFGTSYDYFGTRPLQLTGNVLMCQAAFGARCPQHGRDPLRPTVCGALEIRRRGRAARRPPGQ